MVHLMRSGVANAPYSGKKIVVSTMHMKETVIGDSLERNLNATHMVPAGLNTDALGTFTGEIERSGLVLATAVAKARLGMVKAGIRYGIASEGSYGLHPTIPMLYAGFELMVLVDDLREIIIVESLIDEEPRYFNISVSPGENIESFLDMAGFPDHALIIRPNCWGKFTDGLAKGVRNRNELDAAIGLAATLSPDGKAFIQNDMRAHMNPTRMQRIERLADTLCKRIKTECPECGMPGFGAVSQVKGLPCQHCGQPTSLALGHRHGCVSCSFEQFNAAHLSHAQADPALCEHCNP